MARSRPSQRRRFVLVPRPGPLVLLTQSQQVLSLERFDEVAHLGAPQPVSGDLLVQAELPGKVAPALFPMLGLALARVRLQVIMARGQSGLDRAVGLPAQAPRHVVEADLRMVLHALEHAAAKADLGGLHVDAAVPDEPGSQGGDQAVPVFRSAPSTSSSVGSSQRLWMSVAAIAP